MNTFTHKYYVANCWVFFFQNKVDFFRAFVTRRLHCPNKDSRLYYSFQPWQRRRKPHLLVSILHCLFARRRCLKTSTVHDLPQQMKVCYFFSQTFRKTPSLWWLWCFEVKMNKNSLKCSGIKEEDGTSTIVGKNIFWWRSYDTFKSSKTTTNKPSGVIAVSTAFSNVNNDLSMFLFWKNLLFKKKKR